MLHRFRFALAIPGFFLALLPTQLTYAASCPALGSPVGFCLQLVENSSLTSELDRSIDAAPTSATFNGTYGWDFQLSNPAGNPDANLAQIQVNSGYPASDFSGVSSFPVTYSGGTLTNGSTMERQLTSTITNNFTPGFDSGRSMTPLYIPVGGGKQATRVAVILRAGAPAGAIDVQLDAAYGSTNPSLVSFAGPTNLTHGETLSTNATAAGAHFTLAGGRANTIYSFNVTLHVGNTLNVPITYKPRVIVSVGRAQPTGCGPQPCVGPATSDTISDATLDGPTPGSGQITYSVDPSGLPYVWNEAVGAQSVIRYDGVASQYEPTPAYKNNLWAPSQCPTVVAYLPICQVAMARVAPNGTNTYNAANNDLIMFRLTHAEASLDECNAWVNNTTLTFTLDGTPQTYSSQACQYVASPVNNLFISQIGTWVADVRFTTGQYALGPGLHTAVLTVMVNTPFTYTLGCTSASGLCTTKAGSTTTYTKNVNIT